MGESREQMGERRLGAALWLEVFSFVGPERPHRKTMGVYGIMGRVSQTRSADLFSTHKLLVGSLVISHELPAPHQPPQPPIEVWLVCLRLRFRWRP